MTKPQIIRSFFEESAFLDAHDGSVIFSPKRMMTKPQFIRSFSDESVFLDSHDGSVVSTTTLTAPISIPKGQFYQNFSDALFQDPHPTSGSTDGAGLLTLESLVPIPAILGDSPRFLVHCHPVVSSPAAVLEPMAPLSYPVDYTALCLDTIDKSSDIFINVMPEPSLSLIPVLSDPTVLPAVKPPPFKPLPTGGRSIMGRCLGAIGKVIFNPEVALANATELVVSGAEIYWHRKLICSAIIGPNFLLVVFTGSLIIGWVRRGKLGVSLPGVIEMGAVALTAFSGKWINFFALEAGTKLALKLVFSNAV